MTSGTSAAAPYFAPRGVHTRESRLRPLVRTAKISDAAQGREQRQGAGMRAVLVGLVSAVLGVGTASAAPRFCPEARAVVRAVYDPRDGHSFGPPKRADLSGQEFRVVRVP